MLHRTTLGRHALEALCPSRPNRVACNGCSVSHWDRQTSRGIKDLHMTEPRLGHQRGRGCSVEVPALAWAGLVIRKLMLYALQARARKAGAVEQTVLCTGSGGGCAERPLYAAVSEEPVGA